MDAEIRAEWISELRSGKHRQSKAFLRCDAGHCCLGILGEVLANKGIAEWDKDNLSFDGCGDEAIITIGLRKRIGLDNDVETRLINMNDKEGKSFAEIADYIEKNL